MIQLSSRLICSSVIVYFIFYEVRQLSKEGLSYFKSRWNIFDMSLNISYVIYVPMSFILEFLDSD